MGLAAASCGVVVEDRSFKAHVTLVRARKPRAVGDRVMAALDAAAAGVPGDRVSAVGYLFSSTLTRSGARYEALESWSFRA